MIDAAVILLWHAGRLPWIALAIPARDVALVAGYKLVVGRGYDFPSTSPARRRPGCCTPRSAFMMVTREGTQLAALDLLGRRRAGGDRARRLPAQGPARGGGVKAVVMAGGEGTRLRPLTSNQPKPMVPIVGKPCMEHILELLREHGLEDVIVTVAFMPQAIRGYFGNGESLGLNIEYSVEESPLGTAGSVRLAGDRLDETFLVISGDALCDVDLTELIDAHKEKGAAVTIGLKSVENPLEFGIVVTDEEGRIERFLEKPSWSQVFSDTINTGIYVLEPEALRHVPTDGPYDFSKELFPLLLEMGRPLYGHVLDGYWQDIGNLDQFRQANFDALDERVQLEHQRHPPAREHLAGGRGGGRRPRRDRGPGLPRQLLPRGAGRLGRRLLGARLERDAARARADRALGDRRGDAHRPQRPRRGRGRRASLRHPRARARPRGRGDRRRGHPRRAERGAAAGADLPVQGGRDRRADPREPDLGVARLVEPVRQGRRLRPRQRRPDAGDGGAPGRGARHGAQARRARGREPRVAGGLPDDQAGDDLRPQLDRRQRRRPARASGLGQPPPAEERGLRRRLPHRRQLQRPGDARDPLLRAARDPADGRAAEGDREALHALRAAASGLQRGRLGHLSGPRARELRAGSAREPRRGGDPRPRLPARGRLRLLGHLVRAAAADRPARGRGGLARTASPPTAASRRRGCARRSARRSGSSRRSAPTSASSSTAPASGSS